MRYRICAILAALILCSLLVTPVQAGGWAVVTLDSLPAEVRAGQTLELGFMVRQHGVTPIDTALNSSGSMIPVLTATNLTTGEKIHSDAVKSGGKGHFTVNVTFPTKGEWEWQITPPPFEGTKLGRITVLPAVATTAAEATKPADYSLILRWIGLGVLGLAIVLALAHRLSVSRPRRVAGLH